MRRHKAKTALEFNEGVKILTMQDLKENFDLKKIVYAFDGEKFSRWLSERLYDKEAKEIRKLKIDDEDLAEKICKIFGMNYDEFREQLDDPKTIAWRKERRERLKKFTSDEEILQQIDDVAFDQSDLEDILLEEVLPKKIYLCGESFVFPSGCFRRKNISYVGVNKTLVTIDSKTPIDFNSLNVTFENIDFDDDYKKISGKKVADKKVANKKVADKKVADKKVADKKVKDIILKYSRTTTIENKNGLHARPAYLFAQTANKFESVVQLKANGRTVDAKSILMIMMMRLDKGAEVTISADGPDAKETVDALIELIDSKFGEE